MTATVAPKNEMTTPHRRGINHLALITTDMDATVRFYHLTLGARLVATLGTPEFRHYFFEFGPHCTVAFFEYTNAPTEPFKTGAGSPDSRAAQFDHLALNLPDEEALIDLQHRLKSADCDVTDIVDHGSVHMVGPRPHQPRRHLQRPQALRRPRPRPRCGRAPDHRQRLSRHSWPGSARDAARIGGLAAERDSRSTGGATLTAAL